jgi:hypothetical protein
MTTGIPVERCRRVDLGHAGHQASDSWRWGGREQMTNESTQSSEKRGRKVVRWETPRSRNPSSASLAATERNIRWKEGQTGSRACCGAETIEGEESRRRSAGEICQEQKAVFVVHSPETREALEGLSGESVRLVRMLPAEGASARSVGLEGSWLIFE